MIVSWKIMWEEKLPTNTYFVWQNGDKFVCSNPRELATTESDDT